MEATTCEEYVLQQLRDALAENERLRDEVESLEARLKIMEGMRS